MRKSLLALLLGLTLAAPAAAQERSLIVAATTSVEDSGLFAALLPKFKARTGIDVRVVSRASTEALLAAEHGTVDVVIVNDPGVLDRFVAAGDGTRRHNMMFNDFIIVGPESDPAHVRGLADGALALRKIALDRQPFLSRGDNSGTHLAELRLWRVAGVNPKTRSGNWYRESGLGMGLTLTMATRLKAYTLTDRATWLAAPERAGMEIIVAHDPKLFNPYEIIMVNPAKHPHVNVAAAGAFIDWIMSAEGQNAIASYRIDGERAFYPAVQGQN